MTCGGKGCCAQADSINSGTICIRPSPSRSILRITCGLHLNLLAALFLGESHTSCLST